MKKIICMFLLLALVLSVIPIGIVVNAESLYIEGIRYAIDNTSNTAVISGFDSTARGKIIIPQEVQGYKVTKVGECAFQGSTYIEELVLPEGITYIDSWAFTGSGIKINLPNTLTNLSFMALTGCANKHIKLPDSVVSWGDFLWGSNIENFEFGNGTTIISGQPFGLCFNLKNVYIPKCITNIGSNAFNFYHSDYEGDAVPSLSDVYYGGTEEEWAKVTGNNSGQLANVTMHYNANGLPKSLYEEEKITNVISENGLTYELDSETMIAVVSDCDTTLEGELFIPGKINNYTVTAIGDEAFKYCDWLSAVNIPESIIAIGNNAFECCEGIATMNLHDNIESIGEYAFYNCSALTTINIPEKITKISAGLFSYSGIKSITLSSKVSEIGDNAFSGCKNLRKVNLSLGLLTIGNSAFSGCRTLPEILIPNSVISLGEYAFYECDRLEKVTLSDSMTEIKSETFEGCHELKNIIIPNGIEKINYAAFLGSGLQEITFSSTLTHIGSQVFTGCGINHIKMPNSVLSVGSFLSCGVKNFEFGNGITTIPSGMFYRCFELKNVYIPKTITNIHNEAFDIHMGIYDDGATPALSDIYYGGTAEEWANVSGNKSGQLANVTVHYNATGIPECLISGHKNHEFNKYNLRLDGNIGLGFNTSVCDTILMDDNAYILFKAEGCNDYKLLLSDAVKEENGTYTAYYPLTTVQMSLNVTAQLFDGNGNAANEPVTVSAEDYAKQILGNEQYSYAHDLVKSMTNYTGFAKKYFNKEDIDSDSVESVVADLNNDFSVDGTTEGVEFYGYDLVLDSYTDFRLYFKVNGVVPQFKVDEQVVLAEAFGETGYYYITIPNIAAHELNKCFTVKVNDELTVKACALSYANSVMKTNPDRNLVKLVKALYEYNRAAIEYKNR